MHSAEACTEPPPFPYTQFRSHRRPNVQILQRQLKKMPKNFGKSLLKIGQGFFHSIAAFKIKSIRLIYIPIFSKN